MRKTKIKGQMLIEIVVAIGIIALVLVGVSDLFVRSSRVVTFQKQKDEALSIAIEILNDYRLQRDEDPEGFYTAITGTVLDPCVAGKQYVCTITINKTADATVITVRADWSEGDSDLNVSISQSLSRTIR